MNRPRRPAVTLILLLALPAPAADPAGAAIPAESAPTRRRLLDAERKLAAKPAEAADDLFSILADSGDDLVTADGKWYLPARRQAHAVIARLPTDLLRAYRDRADAPARTLLDRGRADRDPRPLREVVERYLPTRSAAEALLLLGELAFERGEFFAAAGYWRRLLPNCPPADGPHPDPGTDPLAVRARVALAGLFDGDRSGTAADLATLGTAGGRLAGRDGPYADTLRALLATPPTRPGPPADGDWAGFAGGPARDGRAAGRLATFWPARPTWRTPIPRDAPSESAADRLRTFAPTARMAAFHPVVLNGTGYVADPVRVLGFDPLNGRMWTAFDLRAGPDRADWAGEDISLPPPADTDYLLSAADGRVAARLGHPGGDGRLVGLTPRADGTLAEAWRLAPPAAAVWETAPLLSGGRVYATLARPEGNRIVQSVAAYTDPPGQPLWVTAVSDGPAPDRPRPTPLTLAGNVLVSCSHNGLVSGLDADTGKPLWAVRYEPSPPRPPARTPHRGPCPSVAAGGRVVVAPADSDRVFALDGNSGRLLWSAAGFQVEHILGVSRGRVVCALAGPTRGLRAFHLRTGSATEPDGWAVSDDPRLGSFGRGLVADDLVLWPTFAGVFPLAAETGRPVRPPLPGPHGNLCYADGVLVAAGPLELRGYVSDRRELADRQRAAAGRPGDATAARRLALALADSGSWDAASAALAPLAPEDVARETAGWLLHRADAALAAGRADLGRDLLRQCVGGPGPIDTRAAAAGRLVRGDPTVLTTLPPDVAAGWVADAHGVPARVRDAATPRTLAADPPIPPNRPWDDGDANVVAPTRVEKAVPLPNPRCVPLLPFAGEPDLPGFGPAVPPAARRVLVADGETVFAYAAGADRPAWATRLPDDLRATHAAAVGPAVMVAGPRGVARLGLRDGAVEWTVRFPDADLGPAAEPAVRPGLSDFATDGRWLVARLGDHHLAGVDLVRGRAAWVLDGLGRHRYSADPLPSSPQFDPALAVSGGMVVARLSNGRRWRLDAVSVRLIDDSVTAATDWPTPPAVLGPGRVVLADGPGLVRAVGGREWLSDAGREASLTGRPPAVRVLDGTLLVAVSRNHAAELDSLHPRDGGRVWAEPAVLPVAGVDLAGLGADSDHLYVPAGRKLLALRRSGGAQVWAADLPAGGGWRVRAGRDGVVAVPREPAAADPPADVLERLARRFPGSVAAGRLPAAAAGLYDAWTDRAAPVVVFDPATGAVRRRLDLPAGPALAARFGPDGAAVVTGGRVVWLR